MTAANLTPVVFEELDLNAPEILSVAGGQVAVFSRRCPGKETVNEDAAAVIAVDWQSGVLVVADGVGGMQSGNQASSVAVNSMKDRLADLSQPEFMRGAILDAIEEANLGICAMGANAATTLAAIEVQGNRVRPYHVGDSMILLCGQRGKLRWQTIAHSPVGYAVEAGVMDEADAMSHPDRHFVSNIVGCPEMRIEIGPQLQMGARDTLLLCSDGLSDNLSTDEIVEIIRCGDLKTSVQRLVDLATARMQAVSQDVEHPTKPDDLTVVVYRRLPNSSGHDQTAVTRGSKRRSATASQPATASGTEAEQDQRSAVAPEVSAVSVELTADSSPKAAATADCQTLTSANTDRNSVTG